MTLFCKLCGGKAIWKPEEQVWRHAACERGSNDFIICDRYGYPVDVVPIPDAQPSRPVEATPTDTQMLDWLESVVGGCSVSAGGCKDGEIPKDWIVDVWTDEDGVTQGSLRAAIIASMVKHGAVAAPPADTPENDVLISKPYFCGDPVEQLAFELAAELEIAELNPGDLVTVNRDKLIAIARRVSGRLKPPADTAPENTVIAECGHLVFLRSNGKIVAHRDAHGCRCYTSETPIAVAAKNEAAGPASTTDYATAEIDRLRRILSEQGIEVAKLRRELLDAHAYLNFRNQPGPVEPVREWQLVPVNPLHYAGLVASEERADYHMKEWPGTWKKQWRYAAGPWQDAATSAAEGGKPDGASQK